MTKARTAYTQLKGTIFGRQPKTASGETIHRRFFRHVFLWEII